MQPGRVAVVVALISGKKEDLRRCLHALHAQTLIPSELIVPYDDVCVDVTTLQSEYPGVQFVRADGLNTTKARAGASREHHDRLRTIGIRAATADTILLTEDHAYAEVSWCEQMVAALERNIGAGAVGGAVECDSSRLLNWAIWCCDFGRYQNPLPEGRAEFVSDSNVAYRRDALYQVESSWQGDYHETAVHWALAAAGFELLTTPNAIVWQSRSDLDWPRALKERFVWARSFAGTRANLISPIKRGVFAALTPLLPAVMTWRMFRVTLARGVHRRRFLVAFPLVVALQTAWAVGEFVGYVTRKPE